MSERKCQHDGCEQRAIVRSGGVDLCDEHARLVDPLWRELVNEDFDDEGEGSEP